MNSDDESVEREAARLADVLGRLAAITVEGSVARAVLVSRLEELRRLFEAKAGETLEGMVRVLKSRQATMGADVVTASARFTPEELIEVGGRPCFVVHESGVSVAQLAPDGFGRVRMVVRGTASWEEHLAPASVSIPRCIGDRGVPH